MGKPYGLNSVIHKTHEYSYHLLWSRAILHAPRQALKGGIQIVSCSAVKYCFPFKAYFLLLKVKLSNTQRTVNAVNVGKWQMVPQEVLYFSFFIQPHLEKYYIFKGNGTLRLSEKAFSARKYSTSAFIRTIYFLIS